ncbi:QacE family quaternary ammonium compound efflux SMR transporter [Rathayibacter sp. AY1C2]|uniref:DMT family transporter n=1 Tax=unclassified Rathayibacter TaxID=2609250 RepID=UPI000CE77993|nr:MULTISPECIES: SMR family transporter [unclassified Rathayibacter]PPF52535.1 QacE family quaternary ammonium compound efflux SMR transporter [Rathayibacter sp. AY1C2]PPG56741.1 QacE family quaternary ammonium compound efflux SMR transporter [Rathayibacter sp. AY1C7]PPH50101.1 QacE family quaternary ammonium compound efflux SMR transporter [Rathayibacter sp. AY1E1]
MSWVLLTGAILTEVTASLALQAAIESPGWYALVVAGYLAAFVLLSRVLKAGMPIGVAYGVWGACGVALTAVLAAVLFGQPLTGVMKIGLVLIIAGVLMVEIGSQRAQAARRAAH